MAPALALPLIGQEAAACAVLGAVLGSVRALFPEKGRGAFLPDVFFVGALLLGLQSYAASLSAGGVLRWYQLAAALAGARLAVVVLRMPLRALWYLLGLPVHAAQQRLLRVRTARREAKARKKQAKRRRSAEQTAKNPKKNLPRPRRLLYNSNVSK